MLRNNLKITICGLIILAVIGCSNTKFLLDRPLSSRNVYNIKIKADPYAEYKIRNILEKSLPLYGVDLKDYKINITISKKDSSVAYTKKEVAKRQIRMIAKVELYDEKYNKISEKQMDTFSTYEVCDDFPYSDLASQNQAINAILSDLGNSITFAIISEVKR